MPQSQTSNSEKYDNQSVAVWKSIWSAENNVFPEDNGLEWDGLWSIDPITQDNVLHGKIYTNTKTNRNCTQCSTGSPKEATFSFVERNLGRCSFQCNHQSWTYWADLIGGNLINLTSQQQETLLYSRCTDFSCSHTFPLSHVFAVRLSLYSKNVPMRSYIYFHN